MMTCLENGRVLGHLRDGGFLGNSDTEELNKWHDFDPPIYNVWKRRDRRIRDRWMACWTREAIAEAEGLTPQGVGQIWKEFADLQKLSKPDIAKAEYAVDFDPPLYNVWKKQTLTTATHEHILTARCNRLDG